MSKTILPICNWCHKPIIPKEKSVNFPCPNCGKVIIWRCGKCRKMGQPYVCPACGFKGP